MKIVLRKLVRYSKQFPTRVRVGKGADAQAIRRVQLTLEELAANVLDFGELKEASSRKEHLDIGFFNNDVRGVAEICLVEKVSKIFSLL